MLIRCYTETVEDAFVKAVDEPLSGNGIGTDLLCLFGPERGIFYMEERK